MQERIACLHFVFPFISHRKDSTMDMTKLTEEVKNLMNAPSCCPEAKAACEAWLAAVGTDQEETATAQLKAEVAADIMPIEGLIAFAGSDAGEKVFGKDLAAQILTHAKDIASKGATHCDCPACAACATILEILG